MKISWGFVRRRIERWWGDFRLAHSLDAFAERYAHDAYIQRLKTEIAQKDSLIVHQSATIEALQLAVYRISRSNYLT
jgi:hypothetical protein